MAWQGEILLNGQTTATIRLQAETLSEQLAEVGGAHAGGPGDRGRRHHLRACVGGHLVQQRLEQVEIALVDQGHPHGLVDQGVAGLQAGKATTDDHHVGGIAEPCFRRFKLKEKTFSGHQGAEGAWFKRYRESAVVQKIEAFPEAIARLLPKGGPGTSCVSLASLQAFVSAVSSDASLHHKVQQAAGVDDLLTIAADHGHALDKGVLLREHARAVVDAHDDDLHRINSWGDALMHAFGATDKD